MSDVLIIVETENLVTDEGAREVLEVQSGADVVSETVTVAEVLLELGSTELLEGRFDPSVLIELVAGPQGPPGVSEDDVKYCKRVDFINENLFYKGEAVPGSSTVNPVWRIVRTTVGLDGDVTDEWANGTADFVHAWTDRATYAYS